MTIRLTLLSASAMLATLMAAPPAQADVRSGTEAWARGDYLAAVNEWQAPAERGDPDAQFNLAQAYRLGRGVPRDLGKAEELYSKAAAQGHLQAADNYGLLMFDRGEHNQAMPYIRAAADRGDPRAQYLLGIAHFNGDNAPLDWVRAYALMTLAQGSGLPQAAAAIAQMDQHIPLAQRQAAATLAAQLAEQAEANRNSQVAASDLGAKPVTPPIRTVPTPAAAAAPAAARQADAPGADFARTAAARPAASPAPPAKTAPPKTAPAKTTTAPAKPDSADAAPAHPAAEPPVAKPGVARPATPKPAAAKPALATAKPAPAAPATGGWRVQLGAFGVAANADAAWARVKGRPELAGHGRMNVKAGAVSKLQAGGFASREAATRACASLTRAGFTCLAVQD